MWLEFFGVISDDVVFYVFCALAGVIVILSVVNIFIGCCLKIKGRPTPGASMDFYVVFGAIIVTFTVLIEGINSSWGEIDTYATLCQMYPTALMVGLTMFIGGLAVKAWSILIFYKWHKKRPLAEEWKPNLAMWLLILIAAALGIVWVILHRPEIEDLNVIMDGRPVYECAGSHQQEWLLAGSAWHAFLLLLAVIACFVDFCIACRHARGPVTIISVITLNTLACVVAGLCLNFLYENGSATLEYGINGALTLWPLLLANILLLIAKVSGSRGRDHDDHYDKPDSGSLPRTNNINRSSGGYENPEPPMIMDNFSY